MLLTDSRQCYLNHVAALKARGDPETAARTAIGGEFLAMGTLEHELLRSLGLRDGHCVVDVGCGSGRLADQLARYPLLHYVGTDVVPDLLEHAAHVSRRPDWQFTATDGCAIPVESEVADFVCFFSVFTHLLHEQTFRYLREAKRVLRPGGKVVFSFLEFRIPCHWDQFSTTPQHRNANEHLNQFIDREAINVWANRLGLGVETIADGDRPHIPLSHDVPFEQGHVMHGMGNLGQSVAVLRKPHVAVTPTNAPVPSRLDHAVPSPSMTKQPASAAWGTSARGYVCGADSVLILGFAVRSKARQILLRAIGPGLAERGVSQPLRHPILAVHDVSGRLVAQNDRRWVDEASALPEIAAATCAARLSDPRPGDVAMLLQLPAGEYTVVVRGENGEAGNVLAEAYQFLAT
jgi:SAM-dependent methyltransferase